MCYFSQLPFSCKFSLRKSPAKVTGNWMTRTVRSLTEVVGKSSCDLTLMVLYPIFANNLGKFSGFERDGW